MLRARLRTRGRGTYSFGPWTPIYSFCPWEAYGANKRQLPLKIDEGRRGAPILRSPDRKPGFADIKRNTSRVKSVSLEDAIIYSYWGGHTLCFSALRHDWIFWFAVPLLTFLSEEGNPDASKEALTYTYTTAILIDIDQCGLRTLIPEPSSSLVFMLPSRDAKEEGRLTTVES